MYRNKFQILLFLILVQLFINKETNLNFLDHKTLDVLRQIYWSSVELLPDVEIKLNYKNQEIFDKTRTQLKSEISKVAESLINMTDYDLDTIKENKIFEIKEKKDILNLIKNDNIPKKFLINFAFNMDKYSRTEKQEINGALNYINYLTRKELQNFLISQLKEHQILNSPDNFRIYILNDIDFNYPDIDAYIKNKSKKELIQLIYGFEKYCFSTRNEDNSNCQISYQMYLHDSLDTCGEDTLQIYLSVYKRKLDIKDLDIFISLIENHGFTYINKKNLFLKDTKKELIENVKAFETYFNRQNKNENSLTKRDEYIDKLDADQLNDILQWAVDLYPELLEKVRFKDIISSQTNLQYGKVKDFIKISERYKLLKYAYNIHTYQQNISSKYNDDIINFIRFNDNKLYDQISKDTNNNLELQDKTNFEYYASLHEHDIKEYIKNLQRNQLKNITKIMVHYSFLKNHVQDGKILSQKKDLLESIDNMSNEDLLNLALKYIKDLKLKDIYTLQYLETMYQNFDIRVCYLYFYNIMDFFRSTDINYLRIWLRKYELIIRKLKSERYIGGGMKNNFINIEEYSKNELLKVFDIYTNEFPELFHPDKFIKISGLDNGFTPHKFLVENSGDRELLEKIMFSITGHMERKNTQLNFDYNQYLAIFVFSSTEDSINQNYIKNNLIYSIFRIINIYPELNNMVLFKRLCLDENTRILNLFSSSDLQQYFNTGKNLLQIYDNICYYLTVTGFDGFEKMNLDDDSEESLIYYIKNFMNKPFTDTVKSRVLDGDFYSLFYDFSLYLEDESDTVINNIYMGLIRDGHINKNLHDRHLQIEEICETINKYVELQDINNFDSKYNYINITSEGYEIVKDIYNFLIKVENRQIFYYCLIANLIKIGYEKETNSTIENVPDIYLKIHYMSKNEMIRYILNVAKIGSKLKEKFTEENLRRLIKKYFLDIGSDNAYDLTMF